MSHERFVSPHYIIWVTIIHNLWLMNYELSWLILYESYNIMRRYGSFMWLIYSWRNHSIMMASFKNHWRHVCWWQDDVGDEKGHKMPKYDIANPFNVGDIKRILVRLFCISVSTMVKNTCTDFLWRFSVDFSFWLNSLALTLIPWPYPYRYL